MPLSPHRPADIACVAWNPKVQHILASTGHNGQSVVWDLKLKKPVITFSNQNKAAQRNSVVEWNPEVATQVLVASEDDACPVLQIWDLRNAHAPVSELAGHHKGVLATSWCPNDSGLLLSSGKDNRTLCWDPNVGELLCELPAADRWTFDVQWSPRIPALLSSASFDGHLAIFSLQEGSIGGLAWDGRMLCYAMLCCAVLCYAMLC
jgi:protein transport protein SEC31